MKYFNFAVITLGVILAISLLISFIKSKRPVRNLISSSAWGLSTFAVINLTSTLTGISLCATPLSLALCSVLGLPGVLCMVLIKIIWKI